MSKFIKSSILVILVTLATCGFSLSFYLLVDLVDARNQNLELSPYWHVQASTSSMLLLIMIMFGSFVLGLVALNSLTRSKLA
jgi:hypothetical protein